MKPYDEGEMEGRRGRSNANRSNTGSRRSTTGTRTPHNDIDIDHSQQTQAATQQRNISNYITRTRSATTAPDADAFSVGGGNQRAVLAPQEAAGNNNFSQDEDTYATSTSQEQARWNSMVLPDSTTRSTLAETSPATSATASHLGYYCVKKKKHDKQDEEAKADEQEIWDGMVHPDASRSDITSAAVSSTTVTDGTSSGNLLSSNKEKIQANLQNQGQEQETQQNNDSTDNIMATGVATNASPPAPMAGAFAVSSNQTVLRGGEADTFTQVSEVGTTTADQNSVLEPNQNNENGSPVVVQAHLVAYDESQAQRIQQLEAMLQQQQQQQQLQHPLVHAEIARAAPEEMHGNNHDEMSPPYPPFDEQEQQTERGDKSATRSWIMKSRRSRLVALGLVAVVVVVAVIAVAIPKANSSSGTSSSSNKGVASNNGTSPSTSTPFSEEPSVAPSPADTDSPAATSPPTVATSSTANPTKSASPPPTVAATTQNPTRLPTRRPTSPPTTALPTTGTPLPSVAPTPPNTLLLPDGVWQPLGQELGGKAENEFFGRILSLSSDARVLAVGATQTTGAPGHVFVFESDESNGLWVAKGQELVGEASEDWFGSSVSLNGDGTVLAVGAEGSNGDGTSSGYVRVFQHDTSKNRWVQLGPDIDGEADDDKFGSSVSVSKAGDILAVGALRGSDDNRGSVNTFQHDRDTNSWKQLGQTLVGQATGDLFGRSVSLSSTGAILAIGADGHTVNDMWDAGQVAMYQYNSALSEWDPMGSPINGQTGDGYFGISVSLDNSGMVVAVGAPGVPDEWVFVYEYDSSASAWIQRGQTLNQSGGSVSLSGNGSVLAVGSRYDDVNGLEDSGQVTVFQYNANTMEWDTVGASLNGKAAYDNFGESVSLSENGTVVAVGADGRDFNGNWFAGSATVYTLN